MLTAGARDFVSLLSNLGYIWPTKKQLWPLIISALSVKRPERQIRVTFVPGWHGKFFALPDESYGPKGRDGKTLQIMNHHGVGLVISNAQVRSMNGRKWWRGLVGTLRAHA
jgi:hypothetical protein